MKKVFYILTFLLVTHNVTKAQAKVSPEPVPVSKIVKFYPNPASSFINFDLQKGFDNNYSLLIFNFMGKKVYELKNPSPHMNISLEDFYRGIYVFQLRDKNGVTVESGKFQVAK